MEPGSASSFALSDSPATVADVAGRSLRIVRDNFAAIFSLMFVPCLINSFFWELPGWFGQYGKGTSFPQLFLVCSIGSALGVFLTSWAIAIRKYVIIRLTVEPSGDAKEFVRQAESKSWRILLIFLPAIIVELALSIMMTILTSYVYSAESESKSAMIFALVFITLSIFPYGLLNIVNSLFAGIAVTERQSIWSSSLRMIRILITAPWFLIYCCTFFAVMYSILQIPMLLTLYVTAVPKIFTGDLKTVVEIFCELVEFAIYVITSIFYLSYYTIAGSAIYNEYCLRKEGRDIVRKLYELESRIS